jgi:Flp pilus assembly protein TadG
MKKTIFKKVRSERRGTTTVEFALTAPILFLLLMGSIEFSRANMLRHTAVVAATEGARRSIIPGATAAECRQAVVSELATVGFTSADVAIVPAVINADTAQVTVNVSVPLSGANGFVLPRFLTGARIDKSVTLQREAAVVDPSTEHP